MTDDDVHRLAGLVGPCPECQNGKLLAVFDGERTNFRFFAESGEAESFELIAGDHASQDAGESAGG